MYDKRIQWVYAIIETFFSIIRVLMYSCFKKTDVFIKNHDQCIIMGNGPSLIETLKKSHDRLCEYDLIAVNHMALTPEYEQYQPSIYVLCDPAFWFAKGYEKASEKARIMYRMMVEKTTWPLQVYIPVEADKSDIRRVLASNKNISLHFYNKAKFEGFVRISSWIYKKQWGMPRAQNVLIAALMLAIYSRYNEIFLAGAENDWIRNLWVDDQNRLRLSDYHYYKEGQEHTDRILPVKLHEQCASLYHTFKGYIEIERYSKKSNVKIYNINKRSFIDAFDKKSI